MKINEAHDKAHVFGLLQDKRNQKKTRLRHIEATKQDKPRVQGKTTHRVRSRRQVAQEKEAGKTVP